MMAGGYVNVGGMPPNVVVCGGEVQMGGGIAPPPYKL